MKNEKYKNFDFDLFKFRSEGLIVNDEFKKEMELLVLELENKINFFQSCFEYFLITKASDAEFLIYFKTYVNVFKNILECSEKDQNISMKRKSRINISTYEDLKNGEFLFTKRPDDDLHYNEKKLYF